MTDDLYDVRKWWRAVWKSHIVVLNVQGKNREVDEHQRQFRSIFIDTH